MTDPKKVAEGIEAGLRERVNPARRDHGAGYFKTDLEILGVAVPDIRRAARLGARDLRDESAEDVFAVAVA